MGNTPSWSAQCYPDRREVSFDLSRFQSYLPYEIDGLRGTFHLPFNLGHRTLQLEDFIALARQDVPALARVEVDVERKRKIYNEISQKNVDRLVVGMSQPIMKCDSEWRRTQRLDTDLGLIIVETRIVGDVAGILKMEMQPSGWLQRGGAHLVGKAEGSVEIYVRARFEMEKDRMEAKLAAIVTGVFAVGSVLLMRLGWALVTSGGKSKRMTDSGKEKHRSFASVIDGGLIKRGPSEEFTPPIYGVQRIQS